MSASVLESEPWQDDSILPSEPAAKAHVPVLHIITGEHYSGAERIQDLLALQLGQFGFDVTFAALKHGRFADTRQAQGAPLVETVMRSKFDLRPALRLARLVREKKFALIHTHAARSALVGRLTSALTGVPLVHHVHQPTGRDSIRPWRDRINAVAERWSLKGAAAVIACSNSMADYALSEGIPARRICTIANGSPTRGPLANRKHSGTWTLGTVALFRPRKGLEVLLDALAMLKHAGFDVRLRAVGEFKRPQYQEQIQEHIARLGIGKLIDFVGFTNDVPSELAKMDIFVLPSLFGEGLPVVVLEAMAAGVPLVATNSEGVPQAVRDGIDGLLAVPGSAEDLADQIARLITGEVDASQLRRNAYERHRTMFSDTVMAEHVARVYRAVLDHQPIS